MLKSVWIFLDCAYGKHAAFHYKGGLESEKAYPHP